jgi:1-acyl-sn-glycerol-3-phosphate acyltransferase
MVSRLFNFIYAPLAALLFVAVILPLCGLIILGPTLSIRRAIGRAGVRVALAVLGVPFRVRGSEHLPQTACIVISNHASYLDGLVLTAALPARFTFIVQDGAAGWPLVGLTLQRMGVSFVNRAAPREAARQTRDYIRRLQQGESLAVFAEGTFKADPGLLPFKNGAFMMAVRAQVPIAPCVIRGTRQVWGGHHRLPRWGRIDVEILPLILPHGPHKEAELKLRDDVRTQILQRCGEPDARPSLSSNETSSSE